MDFKENLANISRKSDEVFRENKLLARQNGEILTKNWRMIDDIRELLTKDPHSAENAILQKLYKHIFCNYKLLYLPNQPVGLAEWSKRWFDTPKIQAVWVRIPSLSVKIFVIEEQFNILFLYKILIRVISCENVDPSYFNSIFYFNKA